MQKLCALYVVGMYIPLFIYDSWPLKLLFKPLVFFSLFFFLRKGAEQPELVLVIPVMTMSLLMCPLRTCSSFDLSTGAAVFLKSLLVTVF